MVNAVTGIYPGGYQQGFAAAGAIEITNWANAARGDVIQITPAGSIDSTAESLHGTTSSSRLHTAINLGPRNGDGTFSVIDANWNNDTKVLHHNLDPNWASGSIFKIWRFAPGTPPGGWWLGPTPSDGTTIAPSPAPANVPVNVHGEAGAGAALSHIDITWEAEGTNQWSKQTQWLDTNASIQSSDFAYNIPKPGSGWPTSLIISFDVYGTDGRVHYAPQGMRRICIANVSCASTSVTPVSGIGNGQNGGGGTGVNCVPASNQVSVFVDPNYGGSCVTLYLGDYNSPSAIGLPNDSISSIKIGGGAKATLCRDDNFSNTCEDFTGDDSDLSNNSVNTDTVSSIRVVDGQPTSGCSPSPMQVAFFVDTNFNGTCLTRNIGDYSSPGAIGLPNDSISSLKVGLHVKVMICRDDNFSNTCEWYENDDNDLGNNSIGNDQVSSARVISRGHVALCDNTNYGGECHWYGAGDTGINYYNMPDQGFNDRAESIYYEPGYEGMYHVVAYVDTNQSGALMHTDNSVPSLSSPFNNSISSIQIYKHQPSGATTTSPLDGAKFPSTTTDVDLAFDGGDSGRVYVWNDTNTYAFNGDWQSSHTQHLSGLMPGRYHWQAQALNIAGVGDWSAPASFTINTAPQVAGGTLAIDGGTSQTVQLSATDGEQDTLVLTASNVPSFATFTDNHDGTAALTVTPPTSTGGQFTIDLQAYDGELTGTGSFVITVTPTATPPVAALSVSPANGNAPMVITADASGSTAGTNPIDSYTFDFGDGTTVGPQASALATHTYADPGAYTVSVTTTDSIGLTNTASQTVTANLVLPVAGLGLSPASGTAPVSVTADASSSTAGTYPIASYTFDFGDGTVAGPQVGSSATHNYTVAGTYTVKATVIDTHGNSVFTTHGITIAAPTPPTAGLSLTPASGFAPLNVTASASSSTAGSNPITLYTFDFGDGTVVVGPQPGSSASHTYTAPGTYTVTLTVRDSIGLTASTSKTVVVSLAPLVFENFQSGLGNWTTSNAGLATSGSNTFLRFSPKPNKIATASRTVGSAALSPYSKITLRINLNGGTLASGSGSQFYLKQGANTYSVALVNYATQGSSAWQTITIPLADFVGLNKSSTISTLGFSLSSAKPSTFDIDDITFTN